MIKKLLMVGAAFAALSGTAQAAITIGAVDGAAVYVGPTPTYDFETPAPYSGLVTTGSLHNVRAQPYGSTGNYGTAGPTDGTPETFNLSSFGLISSISLLWGSVDDYNTLELLSGATVLATFTGIDVSALANGDQDDPSTNPIVKFTFTGADRLVDGLRFSSTTNAFEFDNIAITTAVPEPATWAMMIGGFGLVGGAMRRRRVQGKIVTA